MSMGKSSKEKSEERTRQCVAWGSLIRGGVREGEVATVWIPQVYGLQTPLGVGWPGGYGGGSMMFSSDHLRIEGAGITSNEMPGGWSWLLTLGGRLPSAPPQPGYRLLLVQNRAFCSSTKAETELRLGLPGIKTRKWRQEPTPHHRGRPRQLAARRKYLIFDRMAGLSDSLIKADRDYGEI